MTIPAGFNQTDYDTPEQYAGIALPSRGGNATGQSAPDGYNQPSKPKPQTDGQSGTQASRRFTDTFFDNHKSPRFPRGRPWTGEREFAANPDKGDLPGFVTTDLMQGEYVVDDYGNNDRAATFRSVWTAPWTPLAKYFRFNYKRKLITFDYQGGLVEHQASLDRYYEAAALIGAGLNVRVEYNEIPPFQVTAKLGFPTKFVPIFRAALAGDPWLLGHRDEPNVKLAEVLGFSERGLRRFSYIPEDEAPLVSAEQVLATPSDQMADLLQKLNAMQEELASLKAEKKQKAGQMANARAAKAARKTETEAPAA